MSSFLRKLFGTPARSRSLRRLAGARPQVEGLEERQVMTVTFHGGSVLPNVEATPIFYGSGWHATAQTKADAAYLTSFLGDVVNSPYMDMLGNAGYGVGRGSAAPATFASDGWSEPDTLDPTKTLTDGNVQNTLQWWVRKDSKFAGLQPDGNRLYVIFVEPGVVVQDNNGNTSANGSGTILAYHNSFAGQDAFGNNVNIRYAVIPYADGAVNNALSWLTTRDSMNSSTSHELAEAVTDPDFSGWKEDGTGNEIGEAGLTQNQQVYVDGYAVQRIADPNDQPMTPADATAARPVTFVVQNRWFPERVQLWPGGPFYTTYWQTNELYEDVSGALQPVTYASGSPVLSIKSVSDQGIDGQGNAMTDVVLNNGYAYEVHDQANFTTANQWPAFLGSNVKDAKAGQGVSYLLYNNGNVSEYTDANGSYTGIDSGVSAIDAGTDRYGVNMEAEVWSGQAWTYSDSTGWQYIPFSAYNVVQISAGRQGYVGFVDDHQYSWYWNPYSGGVTWLNAGMSKITMGYDQYGGLVIDELFANGALWDWRNGNGWQLLGYQGSTITKARAGVLDALLTTGALYQDSPTSNGSLLGSLLASGVQEVG
jgi:hypothetical protein